MNNSEGEERGGQHQTANYFSDLKSGLRKHVRDPKFFIEVLALLGLALYTCETHKTNRLTQRALDISKEQFTQSQILSKQQFKDAQTTSKMQFERDQRPYIWAQETRPVSVGDRDKLAFNVYYANFGKTPALQVRTAGQIFFGKNARQMADGWIAKMHNSTLDNREARVAVVPQGVAPLDYLNAQYFITAYSERIPTEADVKYFTTTDFGIVIVARIEYFGIDGSVRYASDICYQRFGTSGVMVFCRNNENSIQ